tara:strand:+ start:2444 stop:3007 length:564 start_codon:yes stop_codon:yes gene_type:complete
VSKFSNFERRKHDEYLTPLRAALPLKAHLTGVRTFMEPCSGDGRLIRHIESFGPLCIYENDIQKGVDALTDTVLSRTIADAIITNPPYTWQILEQMIQLFPKIAPTWLLLEADFKHTVQAATYMEMCSDVVSIGRVRWFEDTDAEGKINYAWYRFHAQHTRGPVFHPRQSFPPAPRVKKTKTAVEAA